MMVDMAWLGLIVGSFVSIGAYTVLIGDNPISKLTEHIYTGILAGYILAINWDFIMKNAITKVQGGQVSYIIPIILSLMLITRLKPEWLWVSRYPVALTIGVGLGLAMRASVLSDFVGQIQGTLLPLNNINNVVMIIGTMTATAYFLFTTKYTGPYKYVNQTGLLFLLVAFGVTYGSTASFRFELVIGRLVDMLRPDVAMYTYAFLALIVVILFYGYSTKKIPWYKSR
jgi:hypothetical protein